MLLLFIPLHYIRIRLSNPTTVKMKHFTSLIVLTFFAHCCLAQTYFSFVPSLTNSPGTLAEKANFSIEVGRQWDVFSLGLDLGKTSLGRSSGRDTTMYLEIRPNLNVFQVGKFTNTLTPGIGCIFNSKENFMTELTSGIEYAYNSSFHLNIYFGTYYYSGRYSADNVTFFGLSIMYFLKPYTPGPLLNNATTKPAQ